MCLSHNHDHEHHEEHAQANSMKWYRTAGGKLLLVLLLAGLAYPAFVLWTQHRAHVLDFLPLLLFVACPLMHVFMHRGHKGHGRTGDRG